MAQNAITDEQYGKLHRKLDDLLRRVKEGTCLPFADAMDIVQTAISGQGYRLSAQAAKEMNAYGFLTEDQSILAQNLMSRGITGDVGSQESFVKVPSGNLITASFQLQRCTRNQEEKVVITGLYFSGMPTLGDIRIYAGNATSVSFYHFPKGRPAINAPSKEIEVDLELIAEVYRGCNRPRWAFLLESLGVIAQP